MSNSRSGLWLLKLCLIMGVFCFSTNSVLAQLQMVPIPTTSRLGSTAVEPAAATRKTAAMPLPFFDDFSSVFNGKPDQSFWLSGGGTYVNNTYTTNHPSLNVVTFDGVNSKGVPYELANPLSENLTDTLTSQPLDLSSVAVKDSVYISFFWLGKGLGERPDSVDFLGLEFLNKSGTWDQVWKKQGDVLGTQFKQEFVKLADPSFFHAGFQFRFRAYGRSSGMFDMWHLDYVYLNKNRTFRDAYTLDVAVRNPLTSFLKDYSAMPLTHYWLAPAKYTNTSITAEVVNRNNNVNKFPYVFTIYDALSKKVFLDRPKTDADLLSRQELKIAIPVSPLPVDATVKKIDLRYKFTMMTTDKQNGIIDFAKNDSIKADTQLDDYYAFDDGTAEYGVRISQKLGRAAVKYTMPKSDWIGGVRLSMIPFSFDATGQSFMIQIYSDKGGLPDKLLKQQSFSVKYADARNGFVECKFQRSVEVPETFYVGWLQLSEEPFTIGFDRNSSGTGRIFSSTSNAWAVDNNLEGNIMIRPFLGSGEEVPLGVEPGLGKEAMFFPNPSKGEIQWKNESLKRILVYTVDGRLLQTIIPGSGQLSESLMVTPGIYMLKASDGKHTFAQKVLLIK